ncbi:lysophospholipid acyltransferase family protein [Tannerella sp.]|uniref:lysophospholipid acyltransferase family protein n=1 Tax=Tannerella sp. TaxID=2382127 RepID=UPI0026DCBCD0|nr:lysophospholipid acyltransferase family protein [Tannerella sp.]MDO4703295.1 lysophospholipid acyltransferase family protein [Tannerella sp.]
MKKAICRWLLKQMGWQIGPAGDNVPKCVICVAPHTSNTDFLIGKLFYNSVGKQAKFLMKKEWFFFPLGLIFRSMGGVPIDRSRNQSMTEQMAAEFASHDYFRVAITPEGTRKKVDEWKRGFYYIALKAQVPIQLGYIDYGKKEVGIMSTFWPTGDADADIRYIRSCYKGIKGYHGERFGEVEEEQLKTGKNDGK